MSTKYYKQEDGTIYGVLREQSTVKFILPTGSITDNAPVGLTLTNEVSEMAFNEQSESQIINHGVFEVYEDDVAIGITVQMISSMENGLRVDKLYTTADNSLFTMTPSLSLRTAYVGRFGSKQYRMNDEGVQVTVFETYRVDTQGNVIADSETKIALTADGTVHELSGNEVSAIPLSSFDYDIIHASFRNKNNVLEPRKKGYIKYFVNELGESASAFFDNNGNELSKADYATSVANLPALDQPVQIPPSIVAPTVSVVKETDRGDHFTLTSSLFEADPADSLEFAGVEWYGFSDSAQTNQLFHYSTATTSLSIQDLDYDGSIYFAIQHRSVSGVVSDVSASTAGYQHEKYVEPVVHTPTLTVVKHTDRTDHFTLTISPFASTPDGAFEYLTSYIEIYSDAGFTNRLGVTSTQTNSYEMINWTHDGDVYFRAHHVARNGDGNVVYTDWATSGAYQHNTLVPAINTPTLSVVKHTDRPDHFTLTVSPFASTPDGAFNFLGSTFEVYSDANFINRIWIATKAAVAADPLSVEIKDLVHDGDVYFRVNQTATNIDSATNDNSDWATSGAYQHNTYVPAPPVPSLPENMGQQAGVPFAWSTGDSNIPDHDATSWVIASDPDFSNVVYSLLNNTSALYSVGIRLDDAGTYYGRTEYTINGSPTGWSNTQTIVVV